MKSIITLIITSAIFVSLYSHSPSKVNAKFDDQTKFLTVSYSHSVKDASKHYISEVTVYINGKVIISQKLSTQDDSKNGSVIYKIPEAKAGDKIKIKTKCSISGSKNFEMTVKSSPKPVIKGTGKAVPKNEIPDKDAPEKISPDDKKDVKKLVR